MAEQTRKCGHPLGASRWCPDCALVESRERATLPTVTEAETSAEKASSVLTMLERLRHLTPTDVGGTWEDQYVEIVEALSTQADAPVAEPVGPVHGWVTMWPAMGGGHKPVYEQGSERPSYGKELDALLKVYPVYTRPPAPEAARQTAHSDKNVQFADWMLHGIEISGEAADGFKLNAAVRDVLVERQRQVSIEGWAPEHDDEHAGGSLAVAAACYAAFSNPKGSYTRDNPPPIWPWASEWWKPVEPRRNLVKAGALILAEIERLDRAATKQGATK